MSNKKFTKQDVDILIDTVNDTLAHVTQHVKYDSHLQTDIDTLEPLLRKLKLWRIRFTTPAEFPLRLDFDDIELDYRDIETVELVLHTYRILGREVILELNPESISDIELGFDDQKDIDQDLNRGRERDNSN